MKPELETQIAMRLTKLEIATLDTLAAENRRTRSDMARIIFEDLVDGRLSISDVKNDETRRGSAGIRVTRDFKQRFDAFRNGVSADKIMSKALRKLNTKGETNGN